MRLGVALAVIALPVGLLGAAPAAEAQAATCRGLAATIEGASNQSVTGTPGNDVIVAPYGSFGFVNAGAGNDVVCVVPGDTLPDYEELPSFTVQAGDGDDVIDGTALTADQASLFVPSSNGRDAFYGGPEQDQATIPAVNGVPPVDDTEADVFVTGAGEDLVMSGSLGMPNPDVIDTGDGDDVVLYAGSGATGEGRVAGGRGRDALYPTAFDPIDPPDDPLPPGGAVFDARTGTATVAGAPYLTWTGIDDYQLGDIEQNHVTFLGSARPEHVTLSRGTVYVRLGGGDDSVSHYYPSLPDGALFGGPGRDSLHVDVRGRVLVDLLHEAVVADGATTVHLGLAGFEDAEAWGRSVTLFGTAGPNRLGAVARQVATVIGRAGADRIRLGLNASRGLLPNDVRTARGGPGPDVLTGTSRRDALYGGGASDVANGGAAVDLCHAEVRRNCERE